MAVRSASDALGQAAFRVPTPRRWNATSVRPRGCSPCGSPSPTSIWPRRWSRRCGPGPRPAGTATRRVPNRSSRRSGTGRPAPRLGPGGPSHAGQSQRGHLDRSADRAADRPGDGVIIQPPVFTDFKPLVTSAGRTPVRNALAVTTDGLPDRPGRPGGQGLDPSTRMLILCNPHNPVGRVWTREELRQVAAICAEHDVFVLADEIHADIVLSPHQFIPFAACRGRHRRRLGGDAWTDQDLRPGGGLRHAAGHRPRRNRRSVRGEELAAPPHPQQRLRPHRLRGGLPARRDVVRGLPAAGRTQRRSAPAAAAGADPHGPPGGHLSGLAGPARTRSGRSRDPDLARRGGRPSPQPRPLVRQEGAGFARMTIAAPSDTVDRAADQLTTAVSRQCRG